MKMMMMEVITGTSTHPNGILVFTRDPSLLQRSSFVTDTPTRRCSVLLITAGALLLLLSAAVTQPYRHGWTSPACDLLQTALTFKPWFSRWPTPITLNVVGKRDPIPKWIVDSITKHVVCYSPLTGSPHRGKCEICKIFKLVLLSSGAVYFLLCVCTLILPLWAATPSAFCK